MTRTRTQATRLPMGTPNITPRAITPITITTPDMVTADTGVTTTPP